MSMQTIGRERTMYLFSILTKYKFYDKPDGTAIIEKLLASMTLPIGYSFLNETARAAFCEPYRGNTWGQWGSIVKSAFPLCGVAFFFTTGTYIAARVRDKDDPYNHGIGALATGPLLRHMFGLKNAIHLVTILAGVAIGIKYHVIENDRRDRLDEFVKTAPSGVPLNADNWLFSKPLSEPFIKSK